MYTGEVRDQPVHVTVVDYDAERVDVSEVTTTRDLTRFLADDTVTWINLDGIHQVEQVQAVCATFDVHHLWIEDILNPTSRPKAEQIGDQVFVIARMAYSEATTMETEQVAVVLGPGWVLTFQERDGDVWNPLRQRIQNGNGRVRRMRADYLMHALLDGIVDHYFVALESLEARVDALEVRALDPRETVDLTAVFAMKNELSDFRRAVWPMREVIGTLQRSEGGPVTQDVLPYFRDLYDHVVQVMDIVETSRERIVGVYELHIAVAGHRLNDIMKILTIVSTVFIPMTFIAGVYGMNFDHMPELHWRWGYPLAWMWMLGTGLGGAAYMVTRRWI